MLSYLLFFNCSALKLAILERGVSDSPPALSFIVAPLSFFLGLVSFPLCVLYSCLCFQLYPLGHLFFCLSHLCIMERGRLDSRNIIKHFLHRKPILTFKTHWIAFQAVLGCMTTLQVLTKYPYCLHNHLQCI